jgi:spermidine/putrescine transport system substrate-binding protein
VRKQVDSGQIRQVRGNSYKDDLISEDALAVIGWSGDIFQINAENGNKWDFRIPEAGGTYWSDNLLVPVGSPHKTNAEKVFDFYYDPKNAAEVAAYVNYVCPVVGAQEEMEKIDPDLAESEWIFPSDAFLENVKTFVALDADDDQAYAEEFQRATGF